VAAVHVAMALERDKASPKADSHDLDSLAAASHAKVRVNHHVALRVRGSHRAALRGSHRAVPMGKDSHPIKLGTSAPHQGMGSR